MGLARALELIQEATIGDKFRKNKHKKIRVIRRKFSDELT